MTKSIPKTTEGSLSFHKKLKSVVRRAGKKEPSIEQVHGDDLHRDTGKLMHLTRIIDRENNRYHEVIKDKETDKVLHECEEPLSKHQGHGAAKTKKQKY